MRVNVKLFALLAKYLPKGAVKNEAPFEAPDGATVQNVIHALNLPSERCHLVLVDGVYVAPGERDARVLKDGQTLAIWPPVAGG